MKFSTVLAIAFCVAVVSAAPHRDWNDEDNSNVEHNKNYEDNRNSENNSNDQSKSIGQSLGSVGSSSGGGLLGGGILGGGILSKTEKTNNVGQSATIN